MPVRLIVVVLLALCAIGCTTNQERINSWAHEHNATAQVIDGSKYAIQSVTPRFFKSGDHLRVFIEGDGRAWATRTQPSLDPTPSEFGLVDLAVKGGGVYLSRPCQFVMGESCESVVWTDARFGPDAVMAISGAIDALKSRYGAKSVELIGYSGGAAIALLVAAQRSDVNLVQTIAGNVDPAAWATYNDLSALRGSLNPLAFSDKLMKIPQRHFVGTSDTVVPAVLVIGFVGKIAAGCSRVVELAGTHESIVADFDYRLLNEPVVCDLP